MSQEGYDKLVAELQYLESVERPKASAAIAEAADKGDLSENSEYDAAKEAQRHLEARIAEMKMTVAQAKIVDVSRLSTDAVQIMSTVEMTNVKTNAKMKYTIVSETEANLKQNKISIKTPIAQGLLNKKVGDEVEAVILTLDRDERKMSLGIKQLKEDPWEAIAVKYPVGSKHTAKVRNFTNFGIFVELEEGVDGLIHISDLSWTKKVKHPSEFTSQGSEIEVVVLEIDKENRRLSLGHKQLESNPWDEYEAIYTPGSIHEGKITESMDKGAVITLSEGGEGFATPKHLVKQDGTQAQLGEVLPFMVIEFVKDTKRIILSHSRTFEEVKEEPRRQRPAAPGKPKGDAAAINNVAAGTSLGDLGVLADLKKKMEGGK